MSTKIIIQILSIICLAQTIQTQFSTPNYCDTTLCGSAKHIACYNSEIRDFNLDCINPILATLTDDDKNLILSTLNNYRNTVAMGKNPKNFDTAARMMEVEWDDELAYLAELNVKQCEMKHDPCHNTKQFQSTSQAISIRYGPSEEVSFTPYDSIVMLMDPWYNEYTFTYQLDLDSVTTRINQEPVIKHFVAMMFDAMTKVGCGISQYKKVFGGWNYNVILMTCNFSHNNVMYSPVYVKGAPQSQCIKNSSKYSGLCDQNYIRHWTFVKEE